MSLPYNFRGASVHLVDATIVGDVLKFHCSRCNRDLPQEVFQCLGTRDVPFLGKFRSVVVLHPLCFTCRKQVRGAWVNHPDYSIHLDRYWQKLWSGLAGQAPHRGLLVAITKDDLLGKYLEQDGRCALTGMKLDWRQKSGVKRGQRQRNAPSVDRIDSDGNYTLDNIQIVALAVNIMKSDLAMPTFVELCRRIVAKADRAHEAKSAA